jgi:fructokinase
LELLSLPPVTNAPVVVHRLRQTPHGEPFHSFSLVCPNCGRRLPAYRPIRQSTASAAVNRLPDPQAVFVDRISPGIITLVKSAANRGAVVVFEPSSIHEKKLFRKMLALTDVLKYSQDRFLDIDPGWLKNVPLVIETLGRGGVRYRSHLNDRNERGWVHLDAFPVSLYRDSAGSGDWCTAGIAHAIARKGALGFKKLTDVRVRAAISFGQALAAWNCSYEGARGGMYTTDRQDFRREVEQVLARKTSFNPKLDQVSPSASRAITAICSECRRKLKSSASGRLYHAV